MTVSREALTHDWSQRQRHLHKKMKPVVYQRVAVLLETPMNLLIQETTRRIVSDCGVSERDARRSARFLVREVLTGILMVQALEEFREDRHKTYSENGSRQGLVAVK